MSDAPPDLEAIRRRREALALWEQDRKTAYRIVAQLIEAHLYGGTAADPVDRGLVCAELRCIRDAMRAAGEVPELSDFDRLVKELQ